MSKYISKKEDSKKACSNCRYCETTVMSGVGYSNIYIHRCLKWTETDHITGEETGILCQVARLPLIGKCGKSGKFYESHFNIVETEEEADHLNKEAEIEEFMPEAARRVDGRPSSHFSCGLLDEAIKRVKEQRNLSKQC